VRHLLRGLKNTERLGKHPERKSTFIILIRIKQLGVSLSALQLENRLMSWKRDNFWIDNIKIPLVKNGHNKSL